MLIDQNQEGHIKYFKQMTMILAIGKESSDFDFMMHWMNNHGKWNFKLVMQFHTLLSYFEMYAKFILAKCKTQK